jgi:hypothetical protein
MSNYVSTGYVAAGYISEFDTIRDFTFYGNDKVIEISVGVTLVEVQDIYSAWKEWVLVSDNVKYLPAMRAVGGDAISDTKTLGSTYFLTNGWRIRPYSGDHRLTVNGNLYTDPSGSSPFLPAVGNYSVTIELQVSSLVDSSLAQIAEIEQAAFNGEITIDQGNVSTVATSGTAYPIGTFKVPVNNIADAKTIATTRGFDNFYIRGNLTVPSTATDSSGGNLTALRFEGDGATLNVTRTLVTLTSGCVTTNSHWTHCRITGYQGGESIYHDCIIDGLDNAHCFYERCGLLTPSTLTYTIRQTSAVSNGHASYFKDCYSDEGTAIIDRNGARLNMTFDGFHGRIKFINQNHATQSGQVWIHLNGGTVTVDSTCTKGKITVTGFGTLVNYSLGTEVDASGFAAAVAEQAKLDVESLRQSHQGFGSRWYVDHINGTDLAPGNSPASPLKTITAAIGKAVSGRGDVIFLLSPGAVGTPLDERIVMNKEDVHIRAPGRGIMIQPSTITADPVINITANNCSLNGIYLKTSANGSEDGIVVNAKFTRLENMYIVGPDTGGGSAIGTGVGVHFKGGDYHKVFGCEIEKFGSDGVRFTDAPIAGEGSPREVRFDNCNIYYNRGCGIKFTGTSSNSTRLNVVSASRIQNNSDYGINIGPNTQRTMILFDNFIRDNKTFPTGTSAPENEVFVDPAAQFAMVSSRGDTIPDDIWNSVAADYNDVGTFGNKLNTASSGGVDYGALADAVRTELTPELAHIMTLSSNPGLTGTQATMLLELYNMMGLDPAKPLIVTKTGRFAGDITQSITTNTEQTTVQRV